MTCLKSHSEAGAEEGLEPKCPEATLGLVMPFLSGEGLYLHSVLPACGPPGQCNAWRKEAGDSKGPSRRPHDSQRCEVLSLCPMKQQGRH